MHLSRRPARLAALAALLTVAVSGTACSLLFPDPKYQVASDENVLAYYVARYEERCVVVAGPPAYCAERNATLKLAKQHVQEELDALKRNGALKLQRALVKRDAKKLKEGS